MVWKCKRPWKIEEIKPGIYQLRFSLKEDGERILDGRPWICKGVQFLLQAWPEMMTIEEIVFDSSPFWIRMIGLPPGYLNERNGRQLATMVGRVVGFTGRDGSSRRLKVVVDINKPLKAGFFFDRPGMRPLWIQFKFEKLGRFCFKCGMLGHEHEECGRNS